MILFPDFLFENVQSVDLNVLLSNKIKGIILDVDNTLIDYKKNMPSGIKEWVDKAKNMGFKICILSNTNKRKKVSDVSKKLNLKAFMFARKPFKGGFKKALRYLNLSPSECVSIGDQIFTDVLGANISGIHSIYVNPINKKEYWYTKWKRPIENVIIKMYLRKKGC